MYAHTYTQMNGCTILDTYYLTYTVLTCSTFIHVVHYNNSIHLYMYIIITLFIYTRRYNDCKSGVLSPSCPPATNVQGNLHFPLDPISHPHAITVNAECKDEVSMSDEVTVKQSETVHTGYCMRQPNLPITAIRKH